MPPTVVEPKPGVDMGRVLVTVEVENHDDFRAAEEGRLGADAVRRVTCEALVDSGATFLSLPTRMIRELGLRPHRKRRVRTANGMAERTVYSLTVVRVQGRDCVVPAVELPDACDPLLGQIPLEMMDWWIDLSNQRLVGNPRHDGEWQLESY